MSNLILTFKPGKSNKIHIYIDGEYHLTATRKFVEENGLFRNMIINEDELTDLERAVGLHRALSKAYDLLETRNHSKRELRNKLVQKGFSEFADEVCENLDELGLLNDEYFAKIFAEELLRVKHYGKRRIARELFKKGIDGAIVSEIISEIETDTDELERLIASKYSAFLNDEKGLKKTMNALVRKGYSFSEIKNAIRSVKEDDYG